MSRRTRRRQASPDEGLGLSALVIGALVYRQISVLTGPWKLVLVSTITSIVGTAIVWAVRTARRRRKQQLMRAEALQLTPAQFEERIQQLLQDLGWERVARVGGRGDGGVDLRGSYGASAGLCNVSGPQAGLSRNICAISKGRAAMSTPIAPCSSLRGTSRSRATPGCAASRLNYGTAPSWPSALPNSSSGVRTRKWQQRERRRTRWLLGGLATVNGLVLLWATLSAPVFVPTHPVSAARPDTPTMETQPVDQPSTVSASEAPESCGTATISGVERLVLRAAPGLQSQKLAEYPAGTVVMLACDTLVTADGLIWQPVQVEDQEGWMSQRMLQRNP